MHLSKSELYNKFVYEVTRAHVDENGKRHKADKLDGYNFVLAVKECVSILFFLKNDNNFLFKEYGLLKLDVPSKPFDGEKVDDFLSKIVDYIYLFFEKVLILVGSIVVCNEVIKNSATESITNSIFVYAGMFVFVKVFCSFLKFIFDIWKRQCSRILFVTTLQKPLVIIIGEIISNENIRKMEKEEFEKWALKIIFSVERSEVK